MSPLPQPRLSVEALLFDRPRDSVLPQDIVLRLLRYPYALLRDLWRGDLNLRATGLVYATLLSVVPLIAFSFAVLKGLGFHRDLEPLLYEFFRPLGKQASALTDQMLGFVERAQGGVLGSVGLAVLIWTVISTVQKVEEAFNWIWHVEGTRSLARRLSEYLSVMVLGPVMLVSLVGLFAAVGDSALLQKLAHVPVLGFVLTGLGKLGPFVVVALVLSAVYAILPNTRVHWRPALVGGVVAGAAWIACGAGFARLATYSTQMMAVYAGFALVLLVLIWLWLNWLILLLGAQLTFYLQHPAYLRRGQLEVRPTSRLQERLALSTLWLVADAFANGGGAPTATGTRNGWRAIDLAERFDVPGSVLAPVIDALVEHGLLVEADDERLLPARDLGALRLQDALLAVRLGRPEDAKLLGKAHTVPEADRFADDVEQAVLKALDRRTLRELVTKPAG